MTRFKSWRKPDVLHNVMTEYNWLVQYPEGLDSGIESDIGAFTYINAMYGSRIGEVPNYIA